MRTMLMILMVCMVTVAGCKVTPPVITPPQTATTISESVSVITPARQNIQKSATVIQTENAKPEPSKAVISKQATVITENASAIQTEEPKIIIAAANSIETEKQLAAANANITELLEDIAELKEQTQTYFKWIIAGAIVLASALAGIGMYIQNLRLVFAAPIAGAVCVALAILAGAIYEWRNAILIGLGVAVTVVLIGLYIDYRKDGKIGNLFRATDK